MLNFGRILLDLGSLKIIKMPQKIYIYKLQQHSTSGVIIMRNDFINCHGKLVEIYFNWIETRVMVTWVKMTWNISMVEDCSEPDLSQLLWRAEWK